MPAPRRRLLPTLLLLTTALLLGACDDDAGAGATSPGACGGLTCAPDEVCVGQTCRARPGPADAGDDNNPDDNNPDNNNPDDNNPDTPDAGDTPDAADLPDAAPPQEDAGQPAAAVIADPTQITFSIGAAGQVVEQRVLLLNNGERPVDILDIQITSASQGFAITDPPVGMRLERGAVLEFGVTYTAAQVAPASAELRVFTSAPSVLPLSVQVQVKDATTDPCITVTPTRLGFGSVQRGQTATRQVQLTNCGSRDLTVRDLARGSFFGVPTPASFQWSPATPLPLLIPGMGRSTVDVTFSPGRAGLEVGFFEVRSDDPASPAVRVDLNGIAEPPPLTEQDLHIQMEWSSGDSDVDLHFVREGDPAFGCPEDCYYANPNPDWGTPGDWMDDPFLDTDNIQGFGPENINVATLLPGTYRVFLHYYLDSYDGSSSSSTEATVRLYNRGQLLGTFGPQRLDATGRIWEVARIDWPSAQVTPLNQLSTTSQRACP